VGGSAAVVLDVAQDWILLMSGIAVPVIVLRDRRRTSAASAARV
jgi:hypothetical protein